MMSRLRNRVVKGFTLIELMIVVAIIGVLAAVAIPAFMKYIRKSKTTEAVENVKKIYDGARSYYMEESNKQGEVTPIAKQFPDTAAETPAASCCGGATGDKCDPAAEVASWKTPQWSALKFSMDDPHYFVYAYESTGTGVAAEFTARARGDLDCDTVFSTFEMVGEVDDTSRNVTGSAGLFKHQDLE